MTLLRVTHGQNDLVFTEDGRAFIDVISSTGAVFLGHANAAVNQHVVDQLARVSCSWTSVMEIQERCRERVGRHIDDDLVLHCLYSTGMEAAEVAMRMAFHATRRTGIIGFRGNNHGRSVATQNVSGVDADLPRLDGFHRIPFLPDHSESEVLEHLERTLDAVVPAAVFIEPMQGRGGGHAASPEFHQTLQGLCRDRGVLIVCDEIFSGFYRTGPCFRYSAVGIDPDLVLIGKAIGNGFPVAGVLRNRRLDFHPKDFRLSSTFSDNPLACAAVVGSLSEMERIDVEARVAHIEQAFARLEGGSGVEVRLRGAACFVELGSEAAASVADDHLRRNQVLSLRRGATLGFWPPATISPEHLERVVVVANEALERAAA